MRKIHDVALLMAVFYIEVKLKRTDFQVTAETRDSLLRGQIPPQGSTP